MCRYHGGAAPQIRASAREFLELQALHNSRDNLQHLADSAKSEDVRLRATNSALDRAGLKPPEHVEVGIQADWEQVYGDVVGGIAQVSRAESRARRGLADEHPALAGAEVVDAEVVDDPDMRERHPDSPPRGLEPPRPPDPSDYRPAFATDDVEPTPGTGLQRMEDAVAELRVRPIRRRR